MLELLPEPSRKTFLACLRVLDNLWEVFGCSIVTDSMSTKFGFSKVFGCWGIMFDGFTSFVFFLFKNIWQYCLALVASGIFLLI